jgi:hypothetical protein
MCSITPQTTTGSPSADRVDVHLDRLLEELVDQDRASGDRSARRPHFM